MQIDTGRGGKRTLDAIDCKALDVLQRNGRIANVDLSAEAHVMI